MPVQIETERKYLIHMPDEALIAALDGCEIWDIEQIYLQDGPAGETRRVRCVLSEGKRKYFRTEKKRVSALSSIEDEAEISKEAYEALKRQANPALSPISKRRYRVPYEGHLLEIDVYAFWQDRATLEIELTSEDIEAPQPDWLRIIRDVSGEIAYKNRCLAEKVPMEDIGK